jgi:hypothetical protein
MGRYNLNTKAKTKNERATSSYESKETISIWKKQTPAGTITWFRPVWFAAATMAAIGNGPDGTKPVFRYRTLIFKNPEYDQSQGKSEENPEWIWHNDQRALGKKDAAFSYVTDAVKGFLADGDVDSLNTYNASFMPMFPPNRGKDGPAVDAYNPLRWGEITQEHYIMAVIPVAPELDENNRSVPLSEKPIMIEVPRGIYNQLFHEETGLYSRRTKAAQLFGEPVGYDIGLSYTGQKLTTKYYAEIREENAKSDMAAGPNEEPAESYFAEATAPCIISQVEGSSRPDAVIHAFNVFLDIADEATETVVSEAAARKVAEEGDEAYEPEPENMFE